MSAVSTLSVPHTKVVAVFTALLGLVGSRVMAVFWMKGISGGYVSDGGRISFY